MQQKGLSGKTVLAELKKLHNLDQQYVDGRVLCSMCTTPHPIAKKAYQMFFESNLGDSGLFAGTLLIEKEVVHALSTVTPQRECKWICCFRGHRSKSNGFT